MSNTEPFYTSFPFLKDITRDDEPIDNTERLYDPFQQFHSNVLFGFSKFNLVFQGVSITTEHYYGFCCQVKQKQVFEGDDLLLVTYAPGNARWLWVSLLMIGMGLGIAFGLPDINWIGWIEVVLGVPFFAYYVYCRFYLVQIQLVVRDLKGYGGGTDYIDVMFPKNDAEKVRRYLLEYYNAREEKKKNF